MVVHSEEATGLMKQATEWQEEGFATEEMMEAVELHRLLEEELQVMETKWNELRNCYLYQHQPKQENLLDWMHN